MIIDSDIIAYDFMTDFNGPSRLYPNPQYPAGVYDSDNPIYKFGPESSAYPNLTLPCNLYDEWGNEIPQGFYMAVLSDDMKFIARDRKLIHQQYCDIKTDRDTWKRACELACDVILRFTDGCPCKADYFYQQAKKENNND